MTRNRRIVFNVVATYGRSLLSLICGIFTGRWVLSALGEVDYGLYGLVAGLTVFISFFNRLLASAVARFFAYEIGKASKNATEYEGIEECRKWFNTALMTHTLVPVVLMALGYPAGTWAIENWLAIPVDRLLACHTVFKCVCVTCFIAMIEVPFSAMYTAKQYIAELTIYGVVATVFQTGFLYYAATHPDKWLVKYAIWTCCIACIPQILIILRGLKIFPECKINTNYLWNWPRVKQLGYYAGSLAVGGLGGIMRGQGIAILVNKYFGASVNAAMSVANNVNGQSAALVSAMQGAFTPAIVQACGAGEDELMRRMAFRACKFGCLLMLIFALPLGMEIDNVMELWLVNPPRYAAGLCLCMLALVVVDKSAIGHMIAVNAKGKVAMYQFFLGGSLILTLPVAWLFVASGLGVYSIGLALLSMTAVCAIGRVWFARRLAGMSAVTWARKVVVPVGLTAIGACAASCIPRFVQQPSFLRVCETTFLAEVVLLPLAWLLVLDRDEKRYVRQKIVQVSRNLCPRTI